MLKDYFRSLSLNKKLILMMLFLSFVLTSILMVLYTQSEKAMFKEYEAQIVELSKAIQVGVEEITSQGSTDEMRLYQYLKGLNAKGIKEISIISNADEIIASTNLTKVGNPVGRKRKELIIKAELGEPVSKEEGKVYNVIVPVIAGEEHHGYIHLRINTDDFSKVMRINMIKRIIGSLVVFALGIGMAMFLSWRYTRPIHDVVSAAKRVAAGDLSQTLTTKQKDEIGELTQSFNFMVQKLREQRNLEEKLREAEHLSGIGQLSRSMAHEIRNPLNFISLSVDHIKEKYVPDGNKESAEKFRALISSIKQEIQRLNRLVENFLDYGKPMRLNLQKVDIDKLLEDIIGIIWAKAEAEKINIVKDYGPLPVLNIDPELIKTCIFNVILNAFQAMPDGGTLTIKTGARDGILSIYISDTGIGVANDDLSKVFDPFFTTKKNGLGIGLALTRRVVEEHGGKVSLHSIVGKGSEVKIALPIQQTAAAAVKGG
ncbi:MAG: ATP-binding protein [Thermodesulfovibrionales bacterium]|nr:ATP-binding protein [Thermodesulfovibrionales bacterium]